jgi:hypothetical protein
MNRPRNGYGGQGSRKTARDGNSQIAVWSNHSDILVKDIKTVKYSMNEACTLFTCLSGYTGREYDR